MKLKLVLSSALVTASLAMSSLSACNANKPTETAPHATPDTSNADAAAQTDKKFPRDPDVQTQSVPASKTADPAQHPASP